MTHLQKLLERSKKLREYDQSTQLVSGYWDYVTHCYHSNKAKDEMLAIMYDALVYTKTVLVRGNLPLVDKTIERVDQLAKEALGE